MTFPAPAINHQSQVIAVGGLAAWHETTDDGVLLAAVLHVQETEHGEHDRADEVDDQILHRVDQTDVEVAAEAQVLAIDRDLGNVVEISIKVTADSSIWLVRCSTLERM